MLKRVDKQRKQCGEDALLLASLFLWHLSRHDEARKYVDKMLKMNPDSTEGVVARAWIDFTNPNKVSPLKPRKSNRGTYCLLFSFFLPSLGSNNSEKEHQVL